LNKANLSADRTWRSCDTDDILWAQWGADFIAFHRPSGKTHLLNAASEALLTRILVETKTTTDVVRELASAETGEPEDGLVAEIEAMLIHLDELGLIARS